MALSFLLLAALGGGQARAQKQDPFRIKPFVNWGYTAFDMEPTGKTLEEEVKIHRKEKKPIKVTFTAVTGVREWRGVTGKLVKARLLAFDPGFTAGGKVPITLIREGRVRFLLEGEKRFRMVPLASLSPSEQQFIKDLEARSVDGG